MSAIEPGSDVTARWTDKQVNRVIGMLLRAGVIAAALVGVLGGALYLARVGAQTADYRVFRGEPSDLRSIRGIISGALALRSLSIVQLGLLLLIATPVARVALSLVTFILQRDRAYVVVTMIVLSLLLLSLSGLAPG